jgi:hypothetical protein
MDVRITSYRALWDAGAETLAPERWERDDSNDEA